MEFGSTPLSVSEQAEQLLSLHETPSRPTSLRRSPPDVSDAFSPGSTSCSASPGLQTPRMQLVLDIDMTILHACEAPPGSEAQPPEGVYSVFVPKFNGVGMSKYNVRTRHGLHTFLQEVGGFADVHIYTMGAKTYVRQILNAIDSNVELITGRVFCREDGENEIFLKSLTHLQPSIKALAPYIIVDDREEAWDAVSRHALLKVPAFCAFHSNGTALPIATSCTPNGIKVPIPDPTLMHVLRVLKQVHLDWVQGGLQSCAEALQVCRTSVLEGVHLVFSGGILGPHGNETHPMWRLAETYGATCYRKWEHGPITHVVSKLGGSLSVDRAIVNGVHAVTVDWLVKSAEQWRRQREECYPVHPERIRDVAESLPPLFPGRSLQERIEAIRHANQNLIPADVPHQERVDALFTYAAGSMNVRRIKRALAEFAEKGDEGDEGSLHILEQVFEREIINTVVRVVYSESANPEEASAEGFEQ